MSQTKHNIIIEARAELDELKKAREGLLGLGNTYDNLKDSFRTGISFAIGSQLLDSASRIPEMFKSGIDAGIEFNSTVEDSQIGIAAVLKQFDEAGKYESFSDALIDSADAIEYLTEKAKKSPATLKQLIESYQGTAGAMTAARLNIKQQVDLIAQMSQTLGGLGIRSEQILQESRALVTGNINENAAAAKILGITKADIDNAKEAGTLFEFLMGKMAAFSEAADFSQNSLTQITSNMADAFDQIAAQTTEPLFETLKTELGELKSELENGDLADDLKGIGENIAIVAEATINGAEFMVTYAGTIIDVGKAFSALLIAKQVGNLVNWVKTTTSATAAQQRNIAVLEQKIGIMQAYQTQLARVTALQKQLTSLQQLDGNAQVGKMGASIAAMNAQLGITPGIAGRASTALATVKSSVLSLGGMTSIATLGFFAIKWWADWRKAAIEAIGDISSEGIKKQRQILEDFMAAQTKQQSQTALEEAQKEADIIQKRIQQLEGKKKYIPAGDPMSGRVYQLEQGLSIKETDELELRKKQLVSIMKDIELLQNRINSGAQTEVEQANASVANAQKLAELQADEARNADRLAKAKLLSANTDQKIAAAKEQQSKLEEKLTSWQTERNKIQSDLNKGYITEEQAKKALNGISSTEKGLQAELLIILNQINDLTKDKAKAENDASKALLQQKQDAELLLIAQKALILETIDGERQAAEANKDLSQKEREMQLQEILAKRKALLLEIADAYHRMAQAEKDANGGKDTKKSVGYETSAVGYETQSKLTGMGGSAFTGFEGDFWDGLTQGMEKYFDELKEGAELSGKIIQNTLGSAINQTARGLAHSIVYAEDLRSAMADVGLSIAENVLTQILEAQIQQGVYWLLTQTGMIETQALGETLKATSTATTIADATAVEAASAPAAATTATWSFGAAALAALGALGAVFALTKAFKYGGVFHGDGGDGDDLNTVRISDGEGMIRPGAVRGIGGEPVIDYINATGTLPNWVNSAGVSGMSLSTISNNTTSYSNTSNSYSEQVLSALGSQKSTATPSTVNVAMYGTRKEALKAMKGKDGQKILVDGGGRTARNQKRLRA